MTSKCNLLCKYCYGKTTEDFLTEEEKENYDLDLPADMNFKIEELKKFASYDKDFELTFYGGEPLMKIEDIKEIMNKIPAKTFMLQTNGQFLHKLPSEYMNRIHTILVSLDGTEEHTNERRGNKVYEKIIQNLNLIRQNGFKREIIARMTVDETSDVYENVVSLLENTEFKFSSVHWQLDAQFWRADYYERDFNGWAITAYNPKVKKLIDWWINEMKTKGVVHKIYPFFGVLESLWEKEKYLKEVQNKTNSVSNSNSSSARICQNKAGKVENLQGFQSALKCGSGFSLLGIQTNGKVAACPITAGYKPFYMGDIRTSTLKTIEANKIYPDNTCSTCEILDICGGRCLYANKTKLWGQKGFDETCDTIFFLVNSLNSKIPEINKLIENKKIKKEDFNYLKYNGCEIIP